MTNSSILKRERYYLLLSNLLIATMLIFDLWFFLGKIPIPIHYLALMNVLVSIVAYIQYLIKRSIIRRKLIAMDIVPKKESDEEK